MIEIGKIKEGMTGRQVADLLYDNFLEVISGLGEYATEKWVTDKGYITKASLNGYATEQWVTGRGYITASAVAERYATIASVNELAGGVSESLAAVDVALAAVDVALAERVERTKFAEYFSTEMAKWFVKDDANRGIKPVNSYGLYSDTYVSAKGVSTGTGGGGGGTSYDRLDSWAEYTSSKAGYVLSALLGYDLHTRVNNLANAGYITASALSGYAKLSDIPTSLPASDVYSWAKAASKPSYAFSEITNKPTTLDGYGITDAYTSSVIDGKLSGYLPLSGGKITSNSIEVLSLNTKSASLYPAIGFYNNGTRIGVFRLTGNKTASIYDGDFNTAVRIITSGNIGSQSVASAANLTTPRTIWGQSFDGTGNVSGALDNCNWVRYYKGANVSGYIIGRGEEIAGGDGLGLWTYGNTPIFFGAGSVERMRITSAGNVLIGTTVDNGARLHIDGDISFGYYRETSISAKDNYLSLSGRSNELCISGTSDEILYVNYRKNHNGYAPKTWFWKAGNSDSWAAFVLDSVALKNSLNLTYGNNALEVTTVHGKSWFGMMNTSACHIYTDAPIFYMDKSLSVPELNSRGNVVATGSVTAKSSSDYRLKCEFDYNVDYQERLLSLGKVCDFNYTPHAQEREFAFADDKRHTSVIWQDARKANITGFCSVEEDGYGTINPLSSDLIFTMVGAIQQGITKTEKIEERVVRLEKENRELKEKINLLEGGRYGC